jgi:hypothetical protein
MFGRQHSAVLRRHCGEWCSSRQGEGASRSPCCQGKKRLHLISGWTSLLVTSREQTFGALFMLSASSHTPTTLRRRSGLSVCCCSAALILGVGVWVSRAEAACGDYLTIGYGHRPMPGASGTARLPNPTHVGSPLPSEPARSPCAGPHCSSHEMPVTPLQVVVRMQQDLIGACLAQGDGVLTPPPRWATQLQESLAVQDFSFWILRPPRSLSVDRSARDEVA